MNLKSMNFGKCFSRVFQNPKRKSRDLLCWTILFTFTFLHGCGYMLKRKLTTPTQFQSLDTDSPFLKAHMSDGKVYILSSWKVDSESQMVVGQGEVLNANREILETGELTIPIDSVAIFETNTQHSLPTVQARTVVICVIGVGSSLIILGFLGKAMSDNLSAGLTW